MPHVKTKEDKLAADVGSVKVVQLGGCVKLVFFFFKQKTAYEI